jgi:hypothetical protein
MLQTCYLQKTNTNNGKIAFLKQLTIPQMKNIAQLITHIKWMENVQVVLMINLIITLNQINANHVIQIDIIHLNKENV